MREKKRDTVTSGDARLQAQTLSLPPGASARAPRTVLTLSAQVVLAFTQGRHRPCLHPVLTPAGHCVTAEHPADHPHHSGLWIGADRVSWQATGGPGEAHTYNFYVDDVFQGRAPGVIRETEISCDDAGCVTQALEWRGPREWGAQDGRVVLEERRETQVAPIDGGYLIDTVSVLVATGGSVEIGPTRHAYFNARVADVMSLPGAGRLRDSLGHTSGDSISAGSADWVCYAGPVGGGRHASVAVLCAPDSGRNWFAAHWGVITVGPCRRQPLRIEEGESRRLSYRVVVMDDEPDEADLAAQYRAFL